jgi:hypothetical protein
MNAFGLAQSWSLAMSGAMMICCLVPTTSHSCLGKAVLLALDIVKTSIKSTSVGLIVLRTGDQALSTDWCRETVSFL